MKKNQNTEIINITRNVTAVKIFRNVLNIEKTIEKGNY